MRTYTDNYSKLEKSTSKEPRFVVRLSWDEDDTDYTYLTSGPTSALPAGVDHIHSAVHDISGQTQKINPDIAISTIGAVTLKLSDVTEYENLLTYSEAFDNAAWTKTNCSITANQAVSPDKTYTADKVICSGVVNPVVWQTYNTGIALASRTFTYSIWAWTDTGQPTSATLFIYDASAGDVGSQAITLTTTPKRHTFTHTFGGAEADTSIVARIDPVETPAAGNYLYSWGAQLSEKNTSILYTKTEATNRTTNVNALTNKINTKLDAGDGLRSKVARIYVGYHDMPFTEYDLRLTYIIDSISYRDGIYTFNLSDIQRAERHKIFTPDETNLDNNITATDLIIPLATSDTTLFQLVTRGSETLIFPGQTMSYIKIDDEVIAIDSQPKFDVTNGWHVTAVQRGALGTRAVVHAVDAGTQDSRKPKVVEHVYLEGAAPKIIYALQTGLLYHGDNKIESFDFTQWTVSGPPVVAVASDATPTGWGKAYDITDDSATVTESISDSTTDGYVHGDTWTISIFVKKEVAANSSRFDLDFPGGAANSELLGNFDASTGVLVVGTTNATEVAGEAVSLNDDWWYIHISGYTTTTGTTSVRFQIYPAVTGVADTGTITIFGASLSKGDHMGMSVLPLHWHLGINPAFVRLSDFQDLGLDYWNTADNSGRFVRIENPGSQDGKRFIEKEILLWLGAFMPVYSTGELGIKRLKGVLSDSSYVATLNDRNVASYSDLKHDMRAVINDIRVHWNWVDRRKDFTKDSVFIDALSISKHLDADTKVFKFKTVHTGQHTDEDLLTYFDILRDRYSGPPQILAVNLLPSMSHLEVGDTVRVALDQIRDYTTGTTLDRTFEVQQVKTNWGDGSVSLNLFGSSQKAGELDRTTLGNVLADGFYTSEGTALTSVLTIVAGAVTVSATLIGNANNIDDAIYYYDGDLTINTGITVTVTENVQLRIKGALVINGTIDGIGNGATAGAATTQFVGGATSDIVRTLDNLTTPLGSGYDPLLDFDFDSGEQGYFGTTIPASSLATYGAGSATVIQETDNLRMSAVFGGSWLVPTGDRVTNAISTALDNLPFYQIMNTSGGWALSGYPADLRGNSGGGGVPLTRIGFTFGFYEQVHSINANGGAGGDGGAGLMIVTRGLSFGGAGKIDLSGGDSAAGTSWTSVGIDKFYAGSGAPGAPGALLILMDGNATNPDIDFTNFIANYGDAVHGVGVTEVGMEDLGVTNDFGGTDLYTIATWPHGDAAWNEAPSAATENNSMTTAAHRLQYIPEAEGIAVDFGGPLTERGKFNELLFKQKTSPATASDFFGYGVDIIDDGSRFVASDQDTANSLNFYRNAKNPEFEQTLAGVNGEQFGLVLNFDENADRLLSWSPSYLTLQGRLRVYSRSVKTWSLEQSITFGSGGAATLRLFGLNQSWDNQASKLLAGSREPGAHIEYWTRSGATWSFVEVLTEPAGIDHSAFPDGLEISGDGNYAVAADSNYNSSGAIFLYKLTTNTPKWEIVDTLHVPGYDLSSPVIDYNFGTGVGLLSDNGLRLSYDGSAIAVAGLYDSTRWIHSVARQGDTLKYISGLRLDANGFSDARLQRISANGLVAYARSSTGNGDFVVYRRNNIDEGFKFDHSFNNNDGQSVASGDRSNMSPNGQFIVIGNSGSDVGAANAGHVEIWEYYPEAD